MFSVILDLNIICTIAIVEPNTSYGKHSFLYETINSQNAFLINIRAFIFPMIELYKKNRTHNTLNDI